MQHPGELLKAARIQANLSLADVEQATKIRQRHIEALEEGRYDALPGRVYAKGYLRSLAEYYGLEPNEILRLFESVSPSSDRYTITPEVRRISSPNPISGAAVLSVVLVVLLAALGFYAYRQYGEFVSAGIGVSMQARSPGSAGSAVFVTATPTAAVATPTPLPTPSPTPTPIREIVIEVRGVERAWLEVTVDGKRVFYDFLLPGQSYQWTAKNNIVVRSGNAGGVEITFNGKKQGLMGARGDVLQKEWTVPVAGAVN